MSTIEFPGSKSNGSGSETPAEKPATKKAEKAEKPAAAPSARSRGVGSLFVVVLLLVSLAAVAVLYSQRQKLQARVAELETTLAEAAARETQVQDTVGQVAAQLETIQAAIAGVLGAQAAAPDKAAAPAAGTEAPADLEAAPEVEIAPSTTPETEATFQRAPEAALEPSFEAAEPAAGSWTERALERARTATD